MLQADDLTAADWAVVLPQFARHMPVDAAAEARIRQALRAFTLAKGQHWLEAGQVSTQAAFLHTGCMRYYYLDQSGVEHTGQFFFEGAWVGDYASYLTKQPTYQYFQALEDCRLLAITHEAAEQLYDSLPGFERFGRKLAEQVVVGAQQRSASLLRESLEERYLYLVQHRPKVMARVPQHLIASYLGVKPESLSRLRRQLAQRGG